MMIGRWMTHSFFHVVHMKEREVDVMLIVAAADDDVDN